MRKRIEIKFPYKSKLLGFKSFAKYVSVPADLNGILKNLKTGEEDIVTNNFRLDTGADISILNRKCEKILSTMSPVDYIDIQYGAGETSKNCPVYDLGIMIKGHEFEVTAAYDVRCPFLLLGHYRFLEYN